MATGIIIAALLVGGTGLLIGVFLGVAGIKLAVEVDEKEEAVRRRHLQSQKWTQAGLCPRCGGTFKKGFFGTRCTGCGHSK